MNYIGSGREKKAAPTLNAWRRKRGHGGRLHPPLPPISLFVGFERTAVTINRERKAVCSCFARQVHLGTWSASRQSRSLAIAIWMALSLPSAKTDKSGKISHAALGYPRRGIGSKAN